MFIRKMRELRMIGSISVDMNEIPEENHSNEEKEYESKDHMMFAMVKDFCSQTTIHGVRYFTERRRHWIERIFWVIAFILSVSLCTNAILNIWLKWQERPVIVSFNDKTTSIGTIPFPAITICSTEKATKLKIKNIFRLIKALEAIGRNETEMFLNLTAEELNQLDALQHICLQYMLINYEKVSPIPRTESILKTIKDIAPNVPPAAYFYLDNPSEFEPIFTIEGLCYTINSINSRDIYSNVVVPELLTVEKNPNATHWNVEDGYNSSVNPRKLYPKRVFGVGIDNTMNIRMESLIDDFYKICSVLAQGFRIAIHLPNQLPRLPSDFIQIPIEHEIYISIKPNMITTSNGLRRYSPEKRGCFFRAERHLHFFKSYSQQNCELECVTNFTKNECGCVQFWMPRENNTQICGNLMCSSLARNEFAEKLIVENCNCLPDCISITYDVELSQIPIYHLREKASKRYVNSILLVSFKQPHFIAINRSESYTMVDFIASCGGLLGLFMGISLLSIIEFIYYFTLRFFCTIRRRNTIEANDGTWAKCKHCHKDNQQ